MSTNRTGGVSLQGRPNRFSKACNFFLLIPKHTHGTFRSSRVRIQPTRDNAAEEESTAVESAPRYQGKARTRSLSYAFFVVTAYSKEVSHVYSA